MGDEIKRPGRSGASLEATDAAWKARTSRPSSSTSGDEFEDGRAALRARWPEILHRTPNRNGGGSTYCRLGKLLDILVCEKM